MARTRSKATCAAKCGGAYSACWIWVAPAASALARDCRFVGSAPIPTRAPARDRARSLRARRRRRPSRINDYAVGLWMRSLLPNKPRDSHREAGLRRLMADEKETKEA